MSFLPGAFGLMPKALTDGGGDTPTPPIILPTNWRGAVTFDPEVQEEYDTWAGAPADFIWATTNHDSWLNFDANVDLTIATWADDPRPKVWSIPLAVDGTSLASVAAGSNDANFTTAAEKILADAPDDNSAIIIRPGWEANYTGLWAWTAVGAEEDYVAAWQRVHGLFRAVSPRFMFDWNINYVNDPDYDWTTIYPGDAYVDIISADFYHNPYFGDGEDNPPTNTDTVATFNYYFGEGGIIADLVDFAASHEKPMSVPEWGVGWEKPQWVELAAQWIEAQTGLVYHAYFDNNVDVNHQTRISDGSKGLAGHAYLMHFGEDVPVYGEGSFAGYVPGVIGSGGSLPTGWWGQTTGATIEVLGTAVVEQVECLVLEIAATGTGSPNSRWAELFMPFSWGEGPEAAQGEVWRAAVAAQVQSSEGAGVVLYGAKLKELDSGLGSEDYPASTKYEEFPVYADHHTVMRKLTEAGTTTVVFEFDIFLDPTENPSSSIVLIAAPVLTETL